MTIGLTQKSEIRHDIKNDILQVVKKEKVLKVIDFISNKVSVDNKVTEKTRLVVRGFTQRPGEDYHETFTHVAKLMLIRTIFAIAEEENRHLNQMDVETAYLNGKKEKEIYMKMAGIEKYVREIMVK